MRKSKYYEQMYRINEETKRVIIEVTMDRYLDYFHQWDNSAYKKRDLHPDLAQFLDGCSHEIPLNKKLEIIFSIKKREEDIKKEDNIIRSYRHYFLSNLQ